MRNLFKFISGATLCVLALFNLSCEDDISGVGSDLLDSGSTANVMYVDVVSYNTNNDSIRSDEKVLQNGIVGVYEEGVFGRTKARFISQARLNSLNFDFGTNPKMDSVIFRIPVFTKSGDENIAVDTTTVFTAPEGSSDPDTILIKRTYTLDSIYGRTELPMTLQLKEVGNYLYSQDSTFYSNNNLGGANNYINVLPTVLGASIVSNKVTTYQRKASTDNAQAPAPMFEIKLDKDYFNQKFIENANPGDFQDQSGFIRNLFRGIELSVAEDQGFLFNFNPNLLSLAMYISYDNPDPQEEGEEDYEPRKQKILPLNFLNLWSAAPNIGYNVQVNQYDHFNRSAQFVDSYTNPNTTNGDQRLYLDGLDGTKSIIKINQEQLEQIRQNVLNNDWAIVGAELNLYVDDSYGLKKPPYLFAWNSYKEDQKTKNLNFTDLVAFYNSYPISVQFNPMYNYTDNPNVYTIRITDYIKSIVEKNESFEDGEVVLSLGNFLLNPSNSYTSPVSATDPFANNRAFNPYRIVLHGSASEQIEKQLKLKIYYTKK